jgi:hypothetical protein
MVQAWLESWQELYAYLGTVIPPHLFATSVNVPPAVAPLTAESFRWVNFHINRFAFDQLFYGGTVRLEKGSTVGQLPLRLVLQYRVKPLADPNREVFAFLQQMLKDSRFTVDLTWNVVDAIPQIFQHQANLEITWRFTGV